MVTCGHQDCLISLLVVVRRVPLPDDWPPIFSVTGCAINQSCVDVQEMNPYFVAAALVCKFDAESFMRNFERAMHANLPLSFGTRWLDEPTHIGSLTWNTTWSPQWWGARRNW